MRNEAKLAGHSRTTHQRMIDGLLAQYPAARTHGFRKALEGCGSYMADILRHDREWWRSLAVVPDAYIIDLERREIIVFEVVDTHDISSEKRSYYEEIGWAVDQDGFDIIVVRVDRLGREPIAPVYDGLRALERLSIPARETVL